MYVIKEKPSSPPVPNPSALSSDNPDSILAELHSILEEKAPEGIPLLEKLVSLLTPDPHDIVEADKRSRSIIISGVPEGDTNSSPSCRQLATEKHVTNILDALDIEARPAEVYRDVFIRKSMTFSEREKDKQLRAQARELKKDVSDEDFFVVYNEQVVERSEIVNLRRPLGKTIRLIPFAASGMIADIVCFEILMSNAEYHRFIVVYRPPNTKSTDDDHLLSLLSGLEVSTLPPLGAPDHNIVSFTIDRPRCTPIGCTRRDYFNTDIEAVKHELSMTDWYSIINSVSSSSTAT
ncbi:hypothetical protein ANCDUO_07052 [Ancylostoma duodenale]|uniref:Uncharacterized protein n=1 Tax=Ancylostoma duodenale TaxID=51022 RepID=A0A0C2GUJ3_9BILA|nr:hypothetical protein ANCDUO_07052 [Ancylostoma duodenale]